MLKKRWVDDQIIEYQFKYDFLLSEEKKNNKNRCMFEDWEAFSDFWNVSTKLIWLYFVKAYKLDLFVDWLLKLKEGLKHGKRKQNT